MLKFAEAAVLQRRRYLHVVNYYERDNKSITLLIYYLQGKQPTSSALSLSQRAGRTIDLI